MSKETADREEDVMKIPKAFETALQNKEELVLIASANPLLCNSNLESLWELEGFTLRAAFCLVDNLLERNGYQLVLGDEMRWIYSDP